ncbi:FeoA family protein [Flammeovirgaceae bacterium SG7u.111]|nr:FeoA family protein [Flammeovirgaceae bacterium SG7u.132]WPO34153.1 FeoA family protein [Flammeovirgaceae bacterium SG7u.111]
MSRSAANLKIGESGIVSDFLEEGTAAKLIEMGLLPGSRLRLIRTAPLGSPLYIKLDNSSVALRKDEAAHILLT